MTLQDKAMEIKQLVTLICEVIPIVVSIIKEVLLAIKDVKTI